MRPFARTLPFVVLGACVPAAPPTVAPMTTMQPQIAADRLVYPETRRADQVDDY
nr:hypothetical protein [Gemmatimonadota bacterium]